MGRGQHVESGPEVQLREGQMLAGKQFKNWEFRCGKYRSMYGQRSDRWLKEQTNQFKKRGQRDVEAFLQQRAERFAVLTRADDIWEKKGKKVEPKAEDEDDSKDQAKGAAPSPTSAKTATTAPSPIVSPTASSQIETPTKRQTPSPSGGSASSLVLGSSASSSATPGLDLPFDVHGFPTDSFVSQQEANRTSGRKWKQTAKDKIGGPINLAERTHPERQVAMNPYGHFETNETVGVIGGEKVPQSQTAVLLSKDSSTTYRLQNQKIPEVKDLNKTAKFMRGAVKPFLAMDDPHGHGYQPSKHLQLLSKTQLAEAKDILGDRYKVRKTFLQPWKFGPQRIFTHKMEDVKKEENMMAFYEAEIEKAAQVARTSNNWARERRLGEMSKLNTLSRLLRRTVASGQAFAPNVLESSTFGVAKTTS